LIIGRLLWRAKAERERSEVSLAGRSRLR